jgi:hypothetical protein
MRPVEKTNAARMLEARGIAYRTTVYDPERAFHSAEEAAALLGGCGWRPSARRRR